MKLIASFIVFSCVIAASAQTYRQILPKPANAYTPAAQRQMYNMSTPAPRKNNAAGTVTPAQRSEKETDSSAYRTAAKPVVASNKTSKVSGITSWKTGQKLIALTYDDGPNPKFTPKLIQVLQSKKVPATFYLLGESVKAYPSTAALLAKNGFEVANHSYSHPQLTKVSDERLDQEIRKTHDLITSVTGAQVKTIRPPFGSVNAHVQQACEAMGYKVVLWDVDTNDWRKKSAPEMVNTILRETRDGSIILFHDRLQSSIDATEAIIDPLRERGFRFVTVSELLSKPLAEKTSSLSTSDTISSTNAVVP